MVLIAQENTLKKFQNHKNSREYHGIIKKIMVIWVRVISTQNCEKNIGSGALPGKILDNDIGFLKICLGIALALRHPILTPFLTLRGSVNMTLDKPKFYYFR